MWTVSPENLAATKIRKISFDDLCIPIYTRFPGNATMLKRYRKIVTIVRSCFLVAARLTMRTNSVPPVGQHVFRVFFSSYGVTVDMNLSTSVLLYTSWNRVTALQNVWKHSELIINRVR